MRSTHSGKIIICIPIFYKTQLYVIIEKCLDSIEKYYPDVPVITIDDGSPVKCPFATTLKNEKNLGYVKSINKLMEYAFKTADIVIVLNDDLEITKGSLDYLMKIEGLTIASVQDTSGTNNLMFGSNFALTKKTYKLLGGFNEKFKNYFADREFYERALDKGVKIIKDFSVVLPHHESATMKLVGKEELFKEDEAKL
jgi:GT2 family glycosyltransferase